MTPEQWGAFIAVASRRTEELLRARQAKLGEQSLKVDEIEDPVEKIRSLTQKIPVTQLMTQGEPRERARS